LDVDVLLKIVKLITNPDFNISSDSFETFYEIVMGERENDTEFKTFMTSNET
jgi:hypothetical protein